MGFEKRVIPANNLEVRKSDDNKRTISGLGIVYGQVTRLWDDLYEVIHPGAASKVLGADPDIRSAFNHSPNWILGRTKAGTLELEETKEGVTYRATPPETSWAKDLQESIDRKDIDGSSFTFFVEPQDEKITKREDGTYLREIFTFGGIGEIGPVSYPAYEGTKAYVDGRSAKDLYDSYTAGLRAQPDADEIAERQRALSLRRRRLEVSDKEI